jgi:DNA repair exonuclease SbcCD ATPase subunit
MPTVLRKTSLLCAVCLALTGSVAINTGTAQTKPAQTRPESDQAETDSQDASDTADELEAAAVNLDLSHSSPLIQKLYQATRETKEQDIVARLSENCSPTEPTSTAAPRFTGVRHPQAEHH